MISEAAARKIIGPEGASVLIDVVEGAWAEHIAERRRRTRSTRANVLWDYMGDLADELLAPMEGVQRVEHLERPYYILRNRVLLRFKKHSKDWATSNYPTSRQKKARAEGMFEEYSADLVTCGYILDEAEAGIQKVVAARHVENELQWGIPLQELADGQLQPITALLPTFEDEDISALEGIRRVS